MKKVTRREGEPADRLGRIARSMTETLENHPEHGEERCIVILTVEGGECMTHSFGYDPDEAGEGLADLLMHARAIAASVGIDLDLIAQPEQNQG